MSDRIPALYVGGDPDHGVVRLAGDIARAVRVEQPAVSIVEHLAADPAGGDRALHLHFTDKLYGASPEAAARAIAALAARRPITVTLHDVPQASDGPTRLERRRACYRAVVAASAAVAANSRHEAALLKETGVLDDGDPSPTVIPLPAAEPPAGHVPTVRETPGTVALLGWIYPGKGHREAIEAVAGLPGAAASVLALGGPAPGHSSDLDALRALAAARGVTFAATGWLSDAALAQRCRAVAVPLAAHVHLSASASINAWLAAGRRPLVADGRYAREIDALRPATVRIYDPARLSEAIATALADPASTWLTPGTETRPHLADTAQAYLGWWRG